MKKLFILCVLVFTLIFLVSCDTEMQGEETQSAQADYIGTVVYCAKSVPLQETERIQGLWVDGERIFYYHITSGASNNQRLIVKSILDDGADRQSTEIPVIASGEIVGVHAADEDHIGVLSVVSDNIHYTKYCLNGTEQFAQIFYAVNLGGVVSGQNKNAHFSDCGRIILTVNNFHNVSLYILDVVSGESYEMQFFDELIGIENLSDECIVAGFISQNGIVFREINTSSGELENTYNSAVSFVIGMLPAEFNSAFDLLLFDDMYLFGYNLETGERTTLLSWIETGFSNIFDTQIGIFDSGRICVLVEDYIDGALNNTLYVLIPKPRADSPEVITITLGGIYISDRIRRAAVTFNRENSLLQIQIIDYLSDSGDDWDAANLRMRTEIIAGRGPDIMYAPDRALSDGGFLVDLFPFIDSDREIYRTDFFPNALHALKASDGSLTTISDGFAIMTMIGKTDTVGHINSWTPQDLLSLIADTSQMNIPLGFWMDRENFIRTMIQFSGDDFIDWSSHEAHLNTEEFISLLEIAYNLPDFEDILYYSSNASEFELMHTNQQLLSLALLWNPSDYQRFVVGLGEIRALGIPTAEGGVHILQPTTDAHLGISAASDYAEEAWTFLRRFLLPANEVESGFPIRIDLYNTSIAEAMMPIMEEGIEVPRQQLEMQGFKILLYAMEQSDADDLRFIVESAAPIGQWVGSSLWNHMSADLSAFFSGNSTAHDTARIMQSRVQIYLSEQS